MVVIVCEAFWLQVNPQHAPIHTDPTVLLQIPNGQHQQFREVSGEGVEVLLDIGLVEVDKFHAWVMAVGLIAGWGGSRTG